MNNLEKTLYLGHTNCGIRDWLESLDTVLDKTMLRDSVAPKK